jgi:hypothetical protein
MCPIWISPAQYLLKSGYVPLSLAVQFLSPGKRRLAIWLGATPFGQLTIWKSLVGGLIDLIEQMGLLTSCSLSWSITETTAEEPKKIRSEAFGWGLGFFYVPHRALRGRGPNRRDGAIMSVNAGDILCWKFEDIDGLNSWGCTPTSEGFPQIYRILRDSPE